MRSGSSLLAISPSPKRKRRGWLCLGLAWPLLSPGLGFAQERLIRFHIPAKSTREALLDSVDAEVPAEVSFSGVMSIMFRSSASLSPPGRG